MARGGARPGSGPKKGTKYRPRAGKKAKKEKKSLPDEVLEGAALEKLDPLTYMLNVMNDSEADEARRDRMASWSAPYVHAKAGEGKGKRDIQEERAKKAASGKFRQAKAPLKVVK